MSHDIPIFLHALNCHSSLTTNLYCPEIQYDRPLQITVYCRRLMTRSQFYEQYDVKKNNKKMERENSFFTLNMHVGKEVTDAQVVRAGASFT